MARTSEVALLGHTIAPCAKIETQRRAIAREAVQNRRLAPKSAICDGGESVSQSPLKDKAFFDVPGSKPTVRVTVGNGGFASA